MNDIVYAAWHSPVCAVPAPQPDCWRVFYCTEGAGIIAFSQHERPYSPGSMIVFPPDVHPTHTASADTRGIYLHLHQPSLVFRQPYLLQDDANQSLLHLMQDVLWHFSNGAPDNSALLAAYGQLIVQHISARRPSAPRSQLVEDLAQSIVQNYANPQYDLEALLKAAPYCQDYLCRLFRQEMHTTPHKYLTEMRLRAAADALQAGRDSSVAEIARKCGYSDPLYFSRMFKNRYGLSPRDYSKQK